MSFSSPQEVAQLTDTAVTAISKAIIADIPIVEALAQSYSTSFTNLFNSLQQHLTSNYALVHGTMQLSSSQYVSTGITTAPGYTIPQYAGSSSISFVYDGVTYYIPCALYADGFGTHAP